MMINYNENVKNKKINQKHYIKKSQMDEIVANVRSIILIKSSILLLGMTGPIYQLMPRIKIS